MAIADHQDSVVQVHPVVQENATTILFTKMLYLGNSLSSITFKIPLLCLFLIQRPNS